MILASSQATLQMDHREYTNGVYESNFYEILYTTAGRNNEYKECGTCKQQQKLLILGELTESPVRAPMPQFELVLAAHEYQSESL